MICDRKFLEANGYDIGNLTQLAVQILKLQRDTFAIDIRGGPKIFLESPRKHYCSFLFFDIVPRRSIPRWDVSRSAK